MRKLLFAIGLVTVAMTASAQKYLTFGRNPQIPGGLSQAMIENRGWEPYTLPEDTWLTMWGAKGEEVTGLAKKGTRGAWDQYGRFILGPCGNLTSLKKPVKKLPPVKEQPPAKPASPPVLTITRDHWPEPVERERSDIDLKLSASAATGPMTFNFFQPSAAPTTPLHDWRGQTTVTHNSLIGVGWQQPQRPTSIKIRMNSVNNNANNLTAVNNNGTVVNTGSGNATGTVTGTGNGTAKAGGKG